MMLTEFTYVIVPAVSGDLITDVKALLLSNNKQ